MVIVDTIYKVDFGDKNIPNRDSMDRSEKVENYLDVMIVQSDGGRQQETFGASFSYFEEGEFAAQQEVPIWDEMSEYLGSTTEKKSCHITRKKFYGYPCHRAKKRSRLGQLLRN